MRTFNYELFQFQQQTILYGPCPIISGGDFILQRKLMSNLLDDLKSRYYEVKLNIELTVIPILKAIIKKRN